MKKVILALIVGGFIFCFSGSCWSVDLNAPGEKKVTVGSEIKRGCDASFEAFSKSNVSDTRGLIKNFNYVFTKNKQQNTDSQGFIFGAYYMSFIHCYVMWTSVKNPDQRDDLRDWAKIYFDEFKKIGFELKIPDSTAVDLCGPSSGKDIIAKWNSK